MGNQSANMRRPFMKLVEAIEDFEIPYEPTDLDVALDDVPSGMVRQVRLNKRSGEHNKETIGGPFRAWDVLQGLNDQASKSTGDTFYVLYNEDSKRWEVLGQAVGGGTASVIFQIKNAYQTLPLSIEAEWWIGSCNDHGGEYVVPEADLEYGLLKVIDVFGCFFNEPSVQLIGKLGMATRFGSLGGLGFAAFDCAWVVHQMCAINDCGDSQVVF